MKGIITKYRFLLLATLVISVAFLLKNSSAIFNNKQSDFHSFNVSLNEKEYLLESWMDSIEINLVRKSIFKFVNDNKDDIDWLFNEHGISIHVLSDNKYVYWTNNSIHLPISLKPIEAKFTKFQNASVEVRKRENSGFTIIGLILIKHDYPYENDFIKNDFHESFHLNKPCTILQSDKNDQGAIITKEGEYLFTLKGIDSNNSALKNNLILILVVFGTIFILLYGRDLFYNREFKIWHFIIFSSILLGIRFIIQFLIKPDFLLEFELFNPKYFATSDLFPSLGDLLITMSLITYLIFVFYSKVKIYVAEILTVINKTKLTAIWLFVFHLYSLGALYIFRHLVEDSAFQFEAFNVLKLSVYSFVGYLTLILSFIGYVLLVDKASAIFKQNFSFKQLVTIILTLGFVVIFIWLYIGESFDIISYASLLLITIFWFYIKYNYKTRFISIFILVALFSAYSSNYIRRKSFDKRIEETKVMAVNLAREQDPVAEIIIGEIINETKSDTTLKKLLLPIDFSYDNLLEYVRKHYFEGYLRQYNFTITICSPTDSLLVQQGEDNWYHCYNFFESLAKNNGLETNIPGLFHLRNSLGYINYLFQTEIQLGKQYQEVSLFIELINKPNYEVLGYPELLIQKGADIYSAESLENYAKYAGEQLLSSVGDFPYALDRSVYLNTDKEFAFFQTDDFDHLAYNYDNTNSVIISFPTVNFYNTIISFTYIFFFFLIIVTTLSVIGNRFTHIIDFQLSIKNKITFSMILILFISMFIVGGGTIYYTVLQFENNQNKILSEKIQSVIIELEHKLADYNNIKDIDKEYINSLLVKFSNVFYTDINLYDLQGDLIATSRREIFERNLTSNKINAVAYRELVLNSKARIVHKENIGELSYYSAYVPFISANNKLLAYLNLPYFSKEVLLRQELLKVLVAVINIYAFLIILSIIVAIYISNRLTEPLRLVQQRIRDIDISKTNERIDYQGQDEIAELVVEYNRMLDELDKSTMLLAKSERESAWREMARQIAHEIKNPLTPMKLNVQLLEKSWRNNDSDFEDRFSRVTKTLIEQIDSLSSIATAFSQFARMPVAQLEKVDLIKRIHHCYGLFDESENVKLFFDSPEVDEIFVFADNDRILQIFNNLIKNAIQAIPRDKGGEVHITIKKANESVVVEIRDNGIGIPKVMENQLFEPNFTTKTSGTGIGLAIVKNIIEEFGGALWFKSIDGKGTSFFVSMPIYKE